MTAQNHCKYNHYFKFSAFLYYFSRLFLTLRIMTNQELQTLNNKFDIIGNDPGLNRALEIAVAVAPTD